ncbi:MAG: Lrp/AsnC ligand binding domain-containing protein [Candidatus Thorarchaeota archaeon]
MPVKIFIAINVKSGRMNQVQRSIREFEEVTLACSVSDGPYDVVALVEIPTLEDYKSFSIDKVSSLDDITDYTSFITIDQ